MSLVITLYVPEGIVMASDSRLTFSGQQEQGDKQVVQFAIGQTDSNYKTLLAHGKIGISTYGDAAIDGVPIAGYIESFINEKLAPDDEVDVAAQKLLDHYKAFDKPAAAQFHVAGYKSNGAHREQQVWHVAINKDAPERLNPPDGKGASWGGEADILIRLVQQVAVIDPNSQQAQMLPSHPILWHIFTLQDAIDFAIYAIRVTIDSMRFQARAKTVGGPIDVLVIKPNEAFWVQRKALHGETTSVGAPTWKPAPVSNGTQSGAKVAEVKSS